MTMSVRKIEIITEQQLYNCIQSGIQVEIYIGEELDFVGKVLDYNENSILVEEGRYIRSLSKILTKENYLSKI